jgi:hypothetical protein
MAIRKRFFQLCSGPLKGHTISPGTHDHLRATRAGMGTKMRFALPAARPAEHDAATAGRTNSDMVHVYEAFDRVDEISMEIVLCKYIGTHPRMEPMQN